ncbi:MAG: UbiX family flavin prenyltransferase [Oligoflexales bacterium]|nr:UbiX family flavin prenyltransferase [Oligoflexales bacterium]
MKILIGITGASGSIYAERLLQELAPIESVEKIYVVATESGASVARFELAAQKVSEGKKKDRETKALCLLKILQKKIPSELSHKIFVFRNDDFYAPPASGSSVPSHMIVVPCSMGSLARIRHGLSQNLLERSADVVLKEGRQLVICPRESPFGIIHLENMLGLAKMGAKIMPLMPAFYQKPKDLKECIDFMVGKILEGLGLKHSLYPPWAIDRTTKREVQDGGLA